MSRFKFFIDNEEVSEPLKWSEFELTINRDETARVIALQTPLSLMFHSSGYRRLRSLVKANGRGHIASFRVDEYNGSGYSPICRRSINLAEGIENLTQRTWETTIRDGDYSAYVFSNLELKVDCTSVTSKNGTTIAPPAAFDLTVEMVGWKTYVDEKSFDGLVVSAYDLWDVMEYVVSYLSDGELSISSSWYEGLSASEKIALISGGEATLQDGSPLIVTMDELLKTVGRVFNLFLSFGASGLILEPASYFENTDTSISLGVTTDIERSFDMGSVYSNVKLGSSGVGPEESIRVLRQREFFGEAEIFIQTPYAARHELDLQPAYVVNGTAISYIYHRAAQGIVYAGHIENQSFGERGIDISNYREHLSPGWFNDSLKDTNFILEYNSSTNVATRETTDDGEYYYHNPSMTNAAIAGRYSFLGNTYYQPDSEDSFSVKMRSGQFSYINLNGGSTSDAVSFDDKFSEFQGEITGGRYLTGGNVIYEAPQNETKRFTFSVYFPRKVDYSDSDIPGTEFIVNRFSEVRTSANIEYVKTGTLHGSVNTTTLFLSQALEVSVGDSVSVVFQGIDNVADFENYSGTYEVMDVNNDTAVIEIDLDTLSNSYEFQGGTIYPYDEKDSIDLGETDLTLTIHASDNGFSYTKAEESVTYSAIKTLTTYTITADLELDAGDLVYPVIEMSPTSTEVCSVQYVPVVWRDETISPLLFSTANPTEFKGDILKTEGFCNPNQRASILAAPYKAVGIPGGKGWIQRATINVVSGRTELELTSNETYFEG